jgi:ketosteroid isomerase-like protein
MQKRCVASSFVLCTTLAVASLAPWANAHTANQATEEAVLKVSAAIDEAFQKRDANAYAQHVTDDFLRVTGARVYTRADWTKEVVAAGGPARQPAKNDERTVRVFGDVVLVTQRNLPATGQGVQPPVANRMTRAFVRLQGAWKLALTVASPISTSPAAPPTAPVAQPAASGTAPSFTGAAKEVADTLAGLNAANAKADAEAWARLTHADFYIVGSNGNLVTRAARIDQIKAAKPNPAVGALSPDTIVKVYGNVAVSTASNTAGTSRSTKVLIKQDGRWQQVLNQNTTIVRGS